MVKLWMKVQSWIECGIYIRERRQLFCWMEGVCVQGQKFVRKFLYQFWEEVQGFRLVGGSRNKKERIDVSGCEEEMVRFGNILKWKWMRQRSQRWFLLVEIGNLGDKVCRYWKEREFLVCSGCGIFGWKCLLGNGN